MKVQKTTSKKISESSFFIILPAYNEAEVISKVIDGLPRTVEYKSRKMPTKIVVVNDGSHDDTAAVVARRSHVQLINHILNSGAGAATRTGLNYALEQGADYAITMDADGQHAAKDVIRLAEEAMKDLDDFIIGSRLLETRGMPWYRIVGNKFLSFTTYLIFGVSVSDSQSGLKAFNRTALQKITFHSNNYAFCSEMLWKAHQQKLRIREIPIQAIYTDYSLRKGQSNWGAIHIIRQLLKRRLLDFING